MTDCNETLNELYTFLDGELTPSDRQHVQAHLDGCLDCLQAFDFHAELRQVIAEKCRHDEIPAGLLDKVRGCFGDEAVPPA
jgi:mycothiol system anti-sigma-R factor